MGDGLAFLLSRRVETGGEAELHQRRSGLGLQGRRWPRAKGYELAGSWRSVPEALTVASNLGKATPVRELLPVLPVTPIGLGVCGFLINLSLFPFQQCEQAL